MLSSLSSSLIVSSTFTLNFLKFYFSSLDSYDWDLGLQSESSCSPWKLCVHTQDHIMLLLFFCFSMTWDRSWRCLCCYNSGLPLPWTNNTVNLRFVCSVLVMSMYTGFIWVVYKQWRNHWIGRTNRWLFCFTFVSLAIYPIMFSSLQFPDLAFQSSPTSSTSCLLVLWFQFKTDQKIPHPPSLLFNQYLKHKLG